jgi:hypothetical protein
MQIVPVSKAFYVARSIGRRWQMPPDAKTQSLNLFCEEFSDGVISWAGYAPKSLEMRISIEGNQGSRNENNQRDRGSPATDS